MSEVATRIRLCSKDEVAEGSAIRVESGALSLAVYRVADMYYVTDDHCTHGPGSLSEGYLDGHRIECDFHNGAFDIRTGEVLTPPCMVPVKTYRVVLEGEDVFIEP